MIPCDILEKKQNHRNGRGSVIRSRRAVSTIKRQHEGIWARKEIIYQLWWSYDYKIATQFYLYVKSENSPQKAVNFI